LLGSQLPQLVTIFLIRGLRSLISQVKRLRIVDPEALERQRQLLTELFCRFSSSQLIRMNLQANFLSEPLA